MKTEYATSRRPGCGSRPSRAQSRDQVVPSWTNGRKKAAFADVGGVHYGSPTSGRGHGPQDRAPRANEGDAGVHARHRHGAPLLTLAKEPRPRPAVRPPRSDPAFNREQNNEFSKQMQVCWRRGAHHPGHFAAQEAVTDQANVVAETAQELQDETTPSRRDRRGEGAAAATCATLMIAASTATTAISRGACSCLLGLAVCSASKARRPSPPGCPRRHRRDTRP